MDRRAISAVVSIAIKRIIVVLARILFPMIKRSIFSFNYNPSVFDALLMIQQNNLDISFLEIEHMYQCNIDFRNVIDAMLLAKKKNVKVSKSVLRDLAERNKDLIEIINAKRAGEEIFFEEAFVSNKR
jgi:hypothetical protein